MVNLPSPLDVLKFWRSTRTDEHNKLSSYLDSIVVEANDLANVWNNIACKFENEVLFRKEGLNLEAVSIFSELGVITRPNPVIDRLVIDYKQLSSVIGDKVSAEFHADFSDALGGLIHARNEIKDLLVSACRMLQEDKKLPQKILDKVANALRALHREAALLDGLAKFYKAKS